MEQDKLERVIKSLKKHHIGLNPPVSVETVRQIEKQYNITLPKEYVLFITTVGNGGILPDSSGLEQLSQYLYPIEQCDFGKAAIMFPYTEACDWECGVNNSDAGYEKEIASAQCGHFAFTAPDDGDGYTWNLIVSGPRRGEVWGFTDWKICRGICVDFLDWILDCVERGFQRERYDDPWDRTINSPDIRLEQIRKKLKRKKVVLNPVIPVKQIFEIERRYRIKFPKEYVNFLTEIGDGFSSTDCTFGKFMFPLERNKLVQVSQPFPLEDTWVFITNQCRYPQISNQYNISVDADKVWDKIRCGYIILSTEKKRNLPIEQAFLLVISGIKSGEIWCLSYNAAKGEGSYRPLSGTTFVDWLDDYLSGFNF